MCRKEKITRKPAQDRKKPVAMKLLFHWILSARSSIVLGLGSIVSIVCIIIIFSARPARPSKELRSNLEKKKTRSDCLGQVLVNFALGQMKMEVWWSGGQVNLVSVVLLVNKEQTLHTGFQIFFLVLHPRNSSFG